MSDSRASRSLVARFGPFEADLRTRELRKHGRRIALAGLPFEVLVALIEADAALVTRESLHRRLWPDGTFVDFDNNLNAAVTRLRQALGDSAERPKYVATLPRLGYRFVAPITWETPANGSIAPVDDSLRNGDHLAAVVQESGARSRPLRWLSSARASRELRIAVIAGLIGVAGGIVIVAQWPFAVRAPDDSRVAFERGRELLRQGDAKAAAAELRRSIALNPLDAVAHSTLAHALHKSSDQSLVDRADGSSPSIAEAERAVAIDPDCGACHGTLGLFLFYHAWQWERAETHLRKAIELEPGAASIRPSFAMLLVATGRTDQALAQIDAALKDHPHELVWHVIRASILYSSRRYDEAIAAADKALALDDRDRGGWEWRSRALFQAGRGDEAIRALAKVAFAPHAAALEGAVAREGWQGGLRLLLASTGDWQARDEQSWRRGPWRALLRDDEGALDEVERAFQLRNYNLMYVAVDPAFDHLRPHPRFQKVLKDMGLADAVARVQTNEGRE
jgi:DNA-binding winged helix-turn-helix (wHTH) protein/Flp pilus assembly protein TadD